VRILVRRSKSRTSSISAVSRNCSQTAAFLFGELSEDRLVRRLRKNLGFSNRQTLKVLKNVRERQNDLCAALDYLRRDVALTNVRRLLVPRPENQLVREALQTWAAMWPTKPTKLGRQDETSKKGTEVRNAN
jgi:hypothetical protein